MTNSRHSSKPTLIICLSDGHGGMEISSIKLQRNLQDSVECYLLCRSNTFLSDIAKQDQKIAKNTFSLSLAGKPIKKYISIKLIREVRRILKEKNIGNVIFFGSSEMKSLFFAFLTHDINVIMRHATTRSRSRKGPYYRILYSKVRSHVAISHYLAKNVLDVFPIKAPDDVSVIYPALYHRAVTLKASSRNDDKLNIVHTGRVAPGKGHIDAIEACQWLYQNDINFDFTCIGQFGDEEYIKNIKNRIKQKPYSDRIKLVGHVDNVNEYLGQADIFLFPTSGEGFSNSFHEALATGLVCIVYDNTVFPEAANNGFYFHMVENGNEALLGEALLTAAMDLANEIEKARQNVTLATQLFSLESERKKYLNLLV